VPANVPIVQFVRRFEYNGMVYIRPIGRGVRLRDSDRELDEVITELVDANDFGGREVRLRIVVEAPELANDDDPG
jgi:hypothetical protein